MKKVLISFLLLASSAALANTDAAFKKTMRVYGQKKYVDAAGEFFNLAKKGSTPDIRSRSKLYLGISLYRLGLYQTASFPLVEAVRSGNPAIKKMATDYLVATADKLKESSLLSYSLKQVDPSALSETAQGVVEFRKAEGLEAEKEYSQAIQYYKQALEKLKDKGPALYGLGLTYLKNQAPKEAVPYLKQLALLHQNEGFTSMKRGLSVMMLARAYYQAEQWDEAVNLYRSIPKDHPLYRQSLFELSWALIRAGQFRSALSPLQTLHSPYYSNFYDPESLLLRGTILLYVCKFDEIEKIVQTYERTYFPALSSINAFIKTSPSQEIFYKELELARQNLNNIKSEGDIQSGQIPFFVIRSILEEQDIVVISNFLEILKKEKRDLQRIFKKPSHEGLKRYGIKIIDGRFRFAQKKMGRMGLDILEKKQSDLISISQKVGFLKYEMLNGKKELLRKRVTGNNIEVKDEELTRNYFIQNGYRYWPFQGEYWRDEIGNYQYVGVNSCE